MKTVKLWTRNFRLVIFASAIGTLGAIAGGFALAFLVFDETGSTLASALIVAIQLLPYLLLPVLIAPFMDRLPRKSFLVAGDAANAVLLAGMGIWLLFFDFSYVGYLAVSLLLACLGAVDELAFTSIYPELIPEGAEQKGYAVSSMLYPVLKVIMTPLAAILLDTLGVAWILIAQSGFSLAAAVTESFIRLDETERKHREPYSLRAWGNDIREAVQYLKKERGLRSIYGYMAVTTALPAAFPLFWWHFSARSRDSPLPCIPHFPWWNSSDGQSAAQCNTESAFPRKRDTASHFLSIRFMKQWICACSGFLIRLCWSTVGYADFWAVTVQLCGMPPCNAIFRKNCAHASMHSTE